MKKLTIHPMPVPEEGEFSVQIREPGRVRHVAYALNQRLIADARGDARFDETLNMYIEFSPDGPLRNRRFAVMQPNQVVTETDGRRAEYVGTAVSTNTGRVAHIYEVKVTT